jgi:hypothetical protein
MKLKPRGVLDVGPGRGKYGVLICEYLREWANQDVVVDAVAFEPIWCRHAYQEVYRGSALEVLPRMWKVYHLILLIDVVEHFTEAEGERLLKLCAARGQQILITTPKDASRCYQHKSTWTPDEVSKVLLGHAMEVFDHPRAWIMLVKGDVK